MADFNRDDLGRSGRATGSSANLGDWTSAETYWRNNWATRPYVSADRSFDYYSPAYRYGTESATRYRGRQWNDVESDLERGWDSARGSSQSMWADVKEAVRDAWDRVTGHDRGSSHSNR